MLKLPAKRRQQILETLNTLMFASVIMLAGGLGAELMKVLPDTFLMRAYCMSPMLIATFLFTTRFIQHISHDNVTKLFDIEDRRISGMMDIIDRMITQSEKTAGEITNVRERHTALVEECVQSFDEVRKNLTSLAAAIDELRWALRNEENR